MQKLLLFHPACTFPRRIGEDHLLQKLDQLFTFVQKTSEGWRPFKDEAYEEARDEFEKCMLRSVEGFMFNRRAEDKPVLVLKTPALAGIENYPFFQNSQPVVVCRDGRDVVESAVNTEWPNRDNPWREFESAAQRWRDRARTLLSIFDTDLEFSLVKYEDLVLRLRSTMQDLLEKLGLDAKVYDFNEAENAPVIGSAFLPDENGNTIWKPKPKPTDFSPVGRWRYSWDNEQLEKFLDICGPEMEQMGYDISLQPYGKEQ